MIGFISLTYVVFGWLWFTLVLVNGTKPSYLKKAIWSFLPLLITTVLIVWNPNGLFYQAIDGNPMQRQYGPIFWLVFGVALGYCIVAYSYIFRSIRKNRHTQISYQLTWFVSGISVLIGLTCLDIVLNVLFNDDYIFVGITSLGVILSDICFIVAIQKFNVFEIIDVGYRDVIDNISAGAVIVDQRYNILSINHSAGRFMNVKPGDNLMQNDSNDMWIDPKFGQLLKDALIKQSGHYQFEYSFQTGKVRHATIHITTLYNRRKLPVGTVIMLQDITELRSLISELNEKNKELHEVNHKLEEMATTDSLTGCYNRRYLLAYLDQEISKNHFYHHSFSLILFDIDLFKRINDTFGHQIGDEVLRKVAQVAKGCLRASDLIARYGGEEFTIYLPHTGKNEVLEIAEQLRCAIESYQIQTKSGNIQVTISIGATTYSNDRLWQNDPQILLDTLVGRADAALYRAKQEGRNQIIFQ